MLLQILAILAPVFLCILVGWLWARSGRELDTRQMAQLVTEIGSPCLILATIPSLTIDLPTLLTFAGASLAAIACTGLIAWLLLCATRLPWRDFLSPLTFGNHGNMGLSLSLFAFGQEGLALSLVFFTLSTLLHFTVGIGTLDRQFSLARSLRSPLVIAMTVALVLLASGQRLPGWLQETASLLGHIAIPLMLLSLGVALARIGAGEPGRGLQLTVLRVAAGLGGCTVAMTLFGVEGIASDVLWLQSAMPAAVFSYLLAVQYQRSPQPVAGYVLVSTVVSIPLLLGLLWWLGGG